MDFYRFILGTIIVLSLMALAVAIALGMVEEKTSYGLMPILLTFGKIALDFSEYMFRKKDEPEKKADKPEAE